MSDGFRVEVAAVPGWTVCVADTPCAQCPAPCRRFVNGSPADAARAAELASVRPKNCPTSDRRKQ
jgi:hypothetical protein